jgi:hypothetical protein
MRTLFLIVFASVFLNVTVPRAESQKGNIHPKIRIGFSERFRMVTSDNAVSLADSAAAGNAFARHRTGIVGQWFPNDRFECVLKLTNEFRYYFVPENREFDFSEIIIDQLYIKWNNSAILPGTLTLGRQNIILGEGFVVMDGHPLDGSRSIYFNAGRFDWKLSQKDKLILFYAHQPETDNILPVIHDCDAPLIEQPEEGMGAYFTGKLRQTNLDIYFIRKNIKDTDTRPTKSSINTLGARIVHPAAEHLTATAEGAYQFGEYGDANRSAFGGYLYLTYKTDWPSHLPQSLTAGAIYISGDNPSTVDWEAWEPIFGRWPKWSESYIYTLVQENGVAYWTNLVSLYGKARFVISPELKFGLDYHHLMAPREPVANRSFPGGNGKTRGDLFIGRLSFRINGHMTGYLLWERFEPGNYYFDNADGYNWARIELSFNV